MGGSPYWYFVAYEKDKNMALNKLREEEFNAGRYNPVIEDPDFPITDQSPSPGKQHASIDDALEASGADGTRSILDLSSVSTEDEYCNARILTDEELQNYFGTTKPTREILETHDGYFDDIERGKGFCITLYENDEPSELYFVGYSYD